MFVIKEKFGYFLPWNYLTALSVALCKYLTTSMLWAWQMGLKQDEHLFFNVCCLRSLGLSCLCSSTGSPIKRFMKPPSSVRIFLISALIWKCSRINTLSLVHFLVSIWRTVVYNVRIYSHNIHHCIKYCQWPTYTSTTLL